MDTKEPYIGKDLKLGEKIINDYFYITGDISNKNIVNIVMDDDHIKYFHAFCKSNGKICTVKIVPKNKRDIYTAKIKKMEKITDKNLLDFIELIETDENNYLIFENTSDYIKLIKFLVENKSLNEEQKGYIFMQIFRAVVILHLNEISGLDLNLDNIYIDKKLRVKVMGNIYNNFEYSEHIRQAHGGVINYPFRKNIFDFWSDANDGFSEDIWSIGNILFAIITNELAYPLGARVENNRISSMLKTTDASLKNLVGYMLKWKDLERRNIYELLESSWIKRYLIYNNIKEMIFFHEFKNHKFLCDMQEKEEKKISDFVNREILKRFNPKDAQFGTKSIPIIIKTENIFEALLGETGTVNCAINILNRKKTNSSFYRVINKSNKYKTHVIKKNDDDPKDICIYTLMLFLANEKNDTLFRINFNVGDINENNKKIFSDFLIKILSFDEQIIQGINFDML